VLKKLHTPIGLVFTTLFLDKLGENIVYPLLPFILAAYKPDALTLGLVASIGTLFAVLTGPIAGSLSDALGRRSVILVCIAINLISLLMFGWAGSLAMVFTSRALNGVGSSTMGTLQAYITDISTNENRAANLGVSGAAFGLGAIAGPALGGGLVGLGASVPIFVAAGLSGYNLLSATLLLRESLPAEQRQSPRWSALNIVTPVLQLVTRPVVNRISLAFAAFNLCFSAFTSLLVLALKDQFGWNPGQTSGLFVVVGVTLTYVQVALIAKAVRRLGEWEVNRYGMGLVAVGVMTIPAAQILGPWSASMILLGGVLLATGAAFVIPTARSLISGMVNQRSQGVTMGSLASLTGIASAAGPVAAGWIYDQSTLACFLFEAGACLLGVLLLGSPPGAMPIIEGTKAD
jgi:DHA1 family tetracycline resistance protein-like MFS transporter